MQCPLRANLAGFVPFVRASPQIGPIWRLAYTGTLYDWRKKKNADPNRRDNNDLSVMTLTPVPPCR